MADITTFVNEIMTTIINYEESAWIRLLAMLGFLYVIQGVSKTGFDLIRGIAYIVGFFKWMYERRKERSK